jgi:UDP-glucose 4-epimerase
MAFHRVIVKALAGRPFEVFGDGNQTRDFTFVADAVSGTLAAAKYGVSGSAYNIGGGSRRSLNSVLDTLAVLLGREPDRIYSEQQVGDARDTGADIRRAEHDLGYKPSVAFEVGLNAQLEWQRSQLLASEPLVADAGAAPVTG